MRVLHIITSLSTGGAERALFNLLSGGLGTKDDTAVLSLTGEGSFGLRIRNLGIPVHTLDIRGSLPSPKMFVRLRNILRHFQPDLIQGWMYHGNLVASFSGWLAPSNPKVVWNIRHSLYSLKTEKTSTRQVIRVNRFISSYPDAIIYNSCVAREQHQSFGFSSDKAKIIGNGFDTQLLSPDNEKRTAMRLRLGIEPDTNVVGHVARFHPMKNHAGFLRAAVQVLKARTDAIFLLAGRDVELKNPALSGIVPAELEKHFRFLGERKDVHDVMQTMDIFCMTSSWGEAFPNVLAEAMCLKIPCLTTDVGDSCDIVSECGRIIPLGQVGTLADEILALLSLPAPQREQMATLARQRIERHYALPNIVEKYKRLYQQLNEKNTKQGAF